MNNQQFSSSNNQLSQVSMNTPKPFQFIPNKLPPPPIYSYEQNILPNQPKFIPISGGNPGNPPQANFPGQNMQPQGQQLQQAQVPLLVNSQPRQVGLAQYPESSIDSSISSESSSVYVANNWNQSSQPQELRQAPGTNPSYIRPNQLSPPPKQFGNIGQPPSQPSQPINQPFNLPINQPSNPPISSPFNQPSNPPISRPFNQPSNPPISGPFNQPSNPPISGPFNQPPNPPISGPFNQPSREPNSQIINPLIRQPSSQPFFQSANQRSQASSLVNHLNQAPDDGPSSASQLGIYKPYNQPINQTPLYRNHPQINKSAIKWAYYTQGIYKEFSQSDANIIEKALVDNKEYIVLVLDDGEYLLDLKKFRIRKLERNSEPITRMGSGLSWKWKNEDGNWWDYSPEDVKIIETAYKNYRGNRGGDQIKLSNQTYAVNLRDFKQLNINSFFERDVARFVDGYNDNESNAEF